VSATGGDRVLRVGLVGCGAVAEMYHAPALVQVQSMGRAQVTHLVDPSPERVAALKKSFPGAVSTPRVEDLAGAVDLAIIASPVRFHSEQTVALLRAGVHVLCEKPMARTSDEARAMLDAAEQSERVLAIGLYKRFFPAVDWIGQLIHGGVLGRAVRFQLDEGGRFAWPAVTASFFDREQSGGGVTMDIGVHLLDIVLHWFGEPVSFEYADDAYGGIETNAIATLRYPADLEGRFRLSWEVPLSGTYAIDFERGWIRWTTNSAQSVTVGIDGSSYALDARLGAARRDLPRGLGAEGLPYLAAFTAQLVDVCDAIVQGRPPRVTGRDALTGLRLIERMYAGRDVIVPPHFTDAEGARARELARGTVS
jgi:predicted dehydrogenase